MGKQDGLKVFDKPLRLMQDGIIVVASFSIDKSDTSDIHELVVHTNEGKQYVLATSYSYNRVKAYRDWLKSTRESDEVL